MLDFPQGMCNPCMRYSAACACAPTKLALCDDEAPPAPSASAAAARQAPASDRN
jgi:hypothetical protein